jgi:hypothetical protein
MVVFFDLNNAGATPRKIRKGIWFIRLFSCSANADSSVLFWFLNCKFDFHFPAKTRMEPHKVVVGSGNPCKRDAVAKAFAAMIPEEAFEFCHVEVLFSAFNF